MIRRFRLLPIALLALLVAWPTIRAQFGAASDRAPRQPNVIRLSPPLTEKAAQVWLKLLETSGTLFPDEISVKDFLHEIRRQTRDSSFPEGIPISFNPADATTDRGKDITVAIDSKGLPLATTLRLALRQADLDYWVTEEGVIRIESRTLKHFGDRTLAVLNEVRALRLEIQSLREEILGPPGMDSR